MAFSVYHCRVAGIDSRIPHQAALLRGRFYFHLPDIRVVHFRNTFNAVNAVKNGEAGETFSVDELISIDSSCPLLEKLKLELTTPHRDFDRNGRVMVETKKELAKRDVPSPNVADAFIMSFAPTVMPVVISDDFMEWI